MVKHKIWVVSNEVFDIGWNEDKNYLLSKVVYW